MEDGTASVFGLVSGVALSANNGQVVLLAGATGAAAVSMMAGSYLDAATQQDQARARWLGTPRRSGRRKTPRSRSESPGGWRQRAPQPIKWPRFAA
jgi:hypothetical protein